jgi:hypothetical protein
MRVELGHSLRSLERSLTGADLAFDGLCLAVCALGKRGCLQHRDDCGEQKEKGWRGDRESTGEGERLMAFGCGCGNLGKYLGRYCESYLGTDYSKRVGFDGGPPRVARELPLPPPE